jgi:hypothetical protein
MKTSEDIFYCEPHGKKFYLGTNNREYQMEKEGVNFARNVTWHLSLPGGFCSLRLSPRQLAVLPYWIIAIQRNKDTA